MLSNMLFHPLHPLLFLNQPLHGAWDFTNPMWNHRGNGYFLAILSLQVSFTHAIHLSIYPSIHLSTVPIYLSTYLPIHLSTYLPIYLSTYLPIYLSTYLPIYLSTYLSIYPSIHLSIYPSIHLSIYPSIHLSIYPSILSIYLSIRLTTSSNSTICFNYPEDWFSIIGNSQPAISYSITLEYQIMLVKQ